MVLLYGAAAVRGWWCCGGGGEREIPLCFQQWSPWGSCGPLSPTAGKAGPGSRAVERGGGKGVPGILFPDMTSSCGQESVFLISSSLHESVIETQFLGADCY